MKYSKVDRWILLAIIAVSVCWAIYCCVDAQWNTWEDMDVTVMLLCPSLVGVLLPLSELRRMKTNESGLWTVVPNLIALVVIVYLLIRVLTIIPGQLL